MAKKIGRIIKYICFAFILFITCLLVWRMCAYSSLPAEMEALAWNSTTVEAYEQYGEDMQVLELNMPDKYRVAPDGKFSVRAVYYIPEAKQLQLTLCYNDSTLEALEEEQKEKYSEYSLHEPPFNVLLSDDNDRSYIGWLMSSAESGIYNYEKYIFYHVDISDTKELALEVNYLVYTGSDVVLAEPFSAVAVYHSDIPSTPKKLTKADLSGYEALK